MPTGTDYAAAFGFIALADAKAFDADHPAIGVKIEHDPRRYFFRFG